MPKLERTLERIALAMEAQNEHMQSIAETLQQLAHKPSENQELQALRHVVHSTVKAVETLPVSSDMKELLIDQLDWRPLVSKHASTTREERTSEVIRRLEDYAHFTGVELSKGEMRGIMRELNRWLHESDDVIDGEIACLVAAALENR